MEVSENHGLQLASAESARSLRAAAVRRVRDVGREDLADDVELVAGELATNALLHGGGCLGVAISEIAGGVRIEVRDPSRTPPMMGRASEQSMTGRGLLLVSNVASRWGADVDPAGKVVWAELTGRGNVAAELTEEELLGLWAEEWDVARDEQRFHVELGDVPTELLLDAKSHVDNLVREFTLAAAGALAGVTSDLPPQLSSLIETVVNRFAEARLSIKQQALEAARQGRAHTRLALDLPASAAEAAEDYLKGLDEADAYCRATRLLTLEAPPQHRLFRRWYVEELVTQLRAASSGQAPPSTQSFEQRLLRELDRIAEAQRVSERVARLYAVAGALATAATPEAVAEAVLHEGVPALGAVGGGLLWADKDRLVVPGTLGYDEHVVAGLRSESRDAELPAAVALRTGEPVWLESRAELDSRYPQLARLEPTTVSMCAVPLIVQGQRLGALRFSFTESRLFDEEERRFVLALAAQTALALERAQLQKLRLDVSRRLQRSLLPPSLPDIPRVDVAAIYHPFGDGIDVGGDFYDAWQVDANRWAVAIGDSAGTGPEAAAKTALVRHTLRALTMMESRPDRVLQMLNATVIAAATDADTERFCTAIFGTVTVNERVELDLATGGHPPPIARDADGRIRELDVRGSLLGVFEEPDIGRCRLTLDPGSLVVLFTDGVIEAGHGTSRFDVHGVEQVLAATPASAKLTADALERAVLDYSGGALTDDAAAIVLRAVTVSPSPRRA